MRDGAEFNLATWFDESESKRVKRTLKGATADQIQSCLDKTDGQNSLPTSLYIPTARILLAKLEDWIKVKKFDDGFDVSESSDCSVPDKSNECGCECDKVNKVKLVNNNHTCIL